MPVVDERATRITGIDAADELFADAEPNDEYDVTGTGTDTVNTGNTPPAGTGSGCVHDDVPAAHDHPDPDTDTALSGRATLDYIGALKAWLYTPIFFLFGVSKFTVRAPMVLVHVAAVLICVLLVRRYTRLWVATVAAVLLCSEPVFALMARNDWGPVGIGGLLRVVAIYSLLRTLESRDARWFALTTGALSLGVFNKLDFILFAGPFLAASAVLFWPSWSDCWRNQPRRLLASLASLGVVYGLAYVYMYRPSADINRSEDSSLLELLGDRLELLDATFSGNTLSLYMTGQEIPGSSRLLLCSLFAAMSAAVIVALSRFNSDRSAERANQAPPSPGRILALLIAVSAGTVVAMALTPAVSGPHHAAILWPLPALVIAFSLGLAASLQPSAGTIGSVALAGIGVCAVIAFWTQTTTSAQMIRVLRNPVTPNLNLVGRGRGGVRSALDRSRQPTPSGPKTSGDGRLGHGKPDRSACGRADQTTGRRPVGSVHLSERLRPRARDPTEQPDR